VNNMISKHLCKFGTGSDIQHFPLTALIYVLPSFWDLGSAFQLIADCFWVTNKCRHVVV
jgi:hypothetical protein